MARCAERAGLADPNIANHLVIALEPDCASMAIQHQFRMQRKEQREQRQKRAIAKRGRGQVKKATSKFGPKMVECPKVHNAEPAEEMKAAGPVLDESKEDEKAEFEDDLVFRRGDKYILADLGGGTADIAVHEVLSSQSVREIARPSGGAQGSTYIDDAFVKLLERAVGKRWMEEFRITEPNKFVALLCNFRAAKRTFWSKH